MPTVLPSLIRFVRLLLSGHPAIALENAAFRLQRAAFQRSRKRPILSALDRAFWVTSPLFGWHGSLMYVNPDSAVALGQQLATYWPSLDSVQLFIGWNASRAEERRGLTRTGVGYARFTIATLPIWECS